MADLRRRRDDVSDADLIELRLDSVPDPDVAGALEGRRRPVIITCRASWEGGGFRGSEHERRRILREAFERGAEYVDIEWKAGFDDLVRFDNGCRTVLSSHEFGGVPADLQDRARAMRASGAIVVKIAAKANRLSDSLPLLELGRTFDATQRAVLIAMGDAGLATRVLAHRFSSAWVYAGEIHDIGQVTLRALLDTFRFRSVTDHTRAYGLVGSPIAHSVSPAMHNAAFAAAGLDAVYLPLPAADAADFTAFAEAMEIAGASVTIPYKTALLEQVSHADDVTRRVGALNTLRMSADGWQGRNTDGAGFLEPLQHAHVPLTGRRASILGAGGSARAVAVALASQGAVVTVHARDPRKADAVASLASGRVGPFPPPAGSWDLLVNCTPIGMHPRVDESPIPSSALSRGLVYDLVYNPTVTRLLRDAAGANCDTLGGLDMLVAQAQEQFAWWTGHRPAPGVMRAAAVRRLSEFNADEDHLV
jgi:3-dehydroquinate dehydratase/shikimate dehydrogenase